MKLIGALALISLALFAEEVGAQAPLKAELERAAEVRALAQACRELQPELAKHVDTAVNAWWERNAEVNDAVHVLYFGTRARSARPSSKSSRACSSASLPRRSARGR